MSLQATLILLDNSSSAINGDYEPTRWQMQVEGASLLIQAKLESNQQSSVGLGLMGGAQVQILCTMTSDSVKANSFLFGVKCTGQLHFTQAIQIGALTLKHRSNDTQKQRVICFIGSTVAEDVETLKILAKKLKKNAIAVDVVCYGDISAEQTEKLQTFVTTLTNEDNSHLIVVSPGENISDKLIGSPIIGGSAPVQGGAGNLDEEDPQLAAAIRMSLQESQRAVQQNQPQQIPQPQPSRDSAPEANAPREPTEEELEQLAIQMSLQEFNLQESSSKKEDEGKKEEEKKE